MPAYVTEEEQVEAIKAFFKTNARMLLLGGLILAVAFGGWRYWEWRKQTLQTTSSQLYESLMSAVMVEDHVKIHAYAARLIALNQTATYADFARLILAKCDIEEGQGAKAKHYLAIVAAKSTLTILRDIARLRLARLLLSEHHEHEAFSHLNQVSTPGYQPLALALKSEVYLQQHQDEKARQVFQQARELSERQGGMANPLLDLNDAELARRRSHV